MALPLSRFICWDIDGTLVSCGPAGRLALEAGACHAAGLATVPEIVMAGKTDPQIVAEILRLAGLGDAEADALVPAALVEAERALAGSTDRLAKEGRVHPGVSELLSSLTAREGVRQTLVTGNLAVNAALKVEAFGLEGYFDVQVGAYGTDHPDRDCLVPIALERARELRGERYDLDEVWVIGDTERDLRCARAAGVRCLIVGTGYAGFDAVAALEADAVVEDLSETDRILELLLGA